MLACIQLVGSCSIAPGAQPAALRWPGGVGMRARRKVPEGGDVCMHVLDSCSRTAEKLTQHCKAPISRFKKT